jgi:hypothetical protein
MGRDEIITILFPNRSSVPGGGTGRAPELTRNEEQRTDGERRFITPERPAVPRKEVWGPRVTAP